MKVKAVKAPKMHKAGKADEAGEAMKIKAPKGGLKHGEA
jgi:hypothetical protein